MSELSKTELRRLDLTLLLVFLGLVRHRRATDVASDLGLTQSAVSQAVKRLRSIFGDELFLRRPHGMEPTAMALALEAPIADAVSTLRGAVGAARRFDPSAAEGLVRIAALDAEQSVLIPPLARLLAQKALGLRLSVLPLGRSDAVEALVEGRADLAIGYIWNHPETIVDAKLYEETFLVCGRPEALPDAPIVTLDAYCAADHVLISPAGDMRGVVDERLDAIGRSRRVSLGLPAFLPALAAVAASRAIVTLPSRVATAFSEGFGLVTAKPPVEIRRFPISVFWHRRNASDAKSQWLRNQMYAAVATET